MKPCAWLQGTSQRFECVRAAEIRSPFKMLQADLLKRSLIQSGQLLM